MKKFLLLLALGTFSAFAQESIERVKATTEIQELRASVQEYRISDQNLRRDLAELEKQEKSARNELANTSKLNFIKRKKLEEKISDLYYERLRQSRWLGGTDWENAEKKLAKAEKELSFLIRVEDEWVNLFKGIKHTIELGFNIEYLGAGTFINSDYPGDDVYLKTYYINQGLKDIPKVAIIGNDYAVSMLNKDIRGPRDPRTLMKEEINCFSTMHAGALILKANDEIDKKLASSEFVKDDHQLREELKIHKDNVKIYHRSLFEASYNNRLEYKHAEIGFVNIHGFSEGKVQSITIMDGAPGYCREVTDRVVTSYLYYAKEIIRKRDLKMNPNL